MSAIAQIINHLTEWWNGSGQPGGLTGEEIPLESRILGLVTVFQQRAALLQTDHSSDEVLFQALTACRQEQGDRWEPRLVDTLDILVRGLQQGLSLPVALPKISAGMWLIDTQLGSDTIKTGEQVNR